jgi:hypothetical protein
MPEAAPGGTGGAAAAMAQIDAFEARCLAGVQAGAGGSRVSRRACGLVRPGGRRADDHR